MKKNNKQILAGSLLISLTAIIALSLYAPSAYRKGGISTNWHYFNICFTYLLILFIAFPISRHPLYQKLLFCIPAVILGTIVAFVSTEAIVTFLYGSGYEMYADRIVSNLIYYILAFAGGALALAVTRYYIRICTAERRLF